jgi:hypothetical protein
MVELIINGSKIELNPETKIKFTKQISDIFDLAQVSVSHTNSFEFEKTPQNSQAMQQLGISGDNSQIPYIKNTAQLKINGFDLVSNGWFNISGTDDKYKGSVIDGMVDFFKAIENKTLGKDLNLSNFEHEKTLATVIESFTNEYYQYIVADYGGKVLFESGINIDYLTPCFSIRKLWELVFSTFGFECDYTNLSYLDGLYITYPKDIFEPESYDPVATLHKGFFIDEGRVTTGAFSTIRPQYRNWDSEIITEGSIISDWKYVIPESTSYNFNLTSEMYVIYRFPSRANRNTNPRVDILKNGIIIRSILSDYITDVDGVGSPRNISFNITCDVGDVIEMFISAPANIVVNGHIYRNYEWRHNSTNFVISKTDLGTTTLQNELKDFLIKDFIKEQLWRTGLTPILNKETNTVEFITLDSRIDFDNAQDLSHTFIERTGETYTNDYAQKNIFKLKNNVDTDNQGDGFLYVPNKNISDEKIIANSKIYAPDKKIVTNFINGVQTNQYKIWEAEAKDNEGVVEISYKGLSGRFYFIRHYNQAGSFKMISEILNDETIVSSIPVGINTNTLFEEAVYNNYQEYQKIFTNFRVHTISQALTENDFIGMDLTKPFFFKQENAYYICNKISFTEGEKSIGEYIKINKV